MVESCQGTLAEVRKLTGRAEISPVRLTWATMPGPFPTTTIINDAPQYLDVVRVRQDGLVTVATEGQVWPLDQMNMFKDAGEYIFRIIVSAKDSADTPPVKLKLTHTGNWKMAKMEVLK